MLMQPEYSDSLHTMQAIRYMVAVASTSELLQAGRMDTNEEVRRRRLKQLCDANGGVKAVAAKADMHWQTLDQILNKRLLPAKADGTRSPRSLSGESARTLEAIYDLGEGWFDWPFDHVDFKPWAGLNSTQRVFVEAALASAIREASLKAVPDFLHQQAVPDKKVEAHYKRLPAGAAKAALEKAEERQRTSVEVPGDDLFTHPGEPREDR